MSDDTLVAALARVEPFGPRLVAKIDFDSHPSGCWVWTAARDEHGYGKTWDGYQTRSAHRMVYQLLVGPIDNELDHLCVNPSCVNPLHLEDVTHHENLLRAAARITHCPQGHDYSDPKNVAFYDGYRECLACARAKAAKRRAENPPPLKGPWREERVCKRCAAAYEAKTVWQHFCSRSCKRDSYNESRRGR